MKRILIFTAAFYLCGCNFNSKSRGDIEHKIVLEKLAYFNESLQLSTETIHQHNKELLSRIQKEVENKGNRLYDVSLVEKAKQTITLTDQLFNELSDYQKKLKALNSVEQQNNFMIEESNAENIKSLIDNYIDKVNTMNEVELPGFLEENADNIKLFFQESPSIASIGTIETFKLDLLNYEEAILKHYAMMTGTR